MNAKYKGYGAHSEVNVRILRGLLTTAFVLRVLNFSRRNKNQKSVKVEDHSMRYPIVCRAVLCLCYFFVF